MAIKRAKPGAGFAWRWHYGLNMLKRAYDSSRIAADKEKRRIEKTASDHSKLVDEGKATWAEVDEDGYVGFDFGEHLGELLHDEEVVLGSIRTAFVISLYHYVEQRFGNLLPKKANGDPDSDLKKGLAALRQYGWVPQEAELNALRLAANCAKHSQGKSARDLYTLRPDLFDATKIKHGFDPGVESLSIKDGDVEDFFAAVRSSVPSNLGIAF